MANRICTHCQRCPPQLKRPKTGKMVCKQCFFDLFETEVHETIISNKLFTRGEKVALAVSGGKDSTVLAHVMKVLNDRYDYGVDFFLLAIDEGIQGYRDDSLETVKRNHVQYELPLRIISYEQLYGWTMDEIVREIGLKNNCTFCGVFRRQALDRGALFLGVQKLCTGHNADDIAETVLMNILRGDFARLERCVAIITDRDGPIPRCKPFKYTYEKEIVMYAYFKKLDYFTTECIYSPNAYRGHVREYLKDLETVRPSSIIDVIRSAENMVFPPSFAKKPVQGRCERCGYISSQRFCRACSLLDGLNKGVAKLRIKSAEDMEPEHESTTTHHPTTPSSQPPQSSSSSSTSTSSSSTTSACSGNGSCRSGGCQSSSGVETVVPGGGPRVVVVRLQSEDLVCVDETSCDRTTKGQCTRTQCHRGTCASDDAVSTDDGGNKNRVVGGGGGGWNAFPSNDEASITHPDRRNTKSDAASSIEGSSSPSSTSTLLSPLSTPATLSASLVSINGSSPNHHHLQQQQQQSPHQQNNPHSSQRVSHRSLDF